MKYILVSLFLITYIFSRDINSAYFPKWKLEVKNEFGTDEEIVLKAGQYTKVTFVVSNENDYTYYERFFDSSKFRIFLNDDNLVTLKEEYEINPFESLEYTTYIGLNCENQINTKEYSFTFSTKEEENSDENTPKLKVVSTTVKIDKTPQKITLTPVSTTLLEHSVSHFILKEIIYNINPIYVDSRDSDDNFFLNSVEIPKFTSVDEKFENQLLMDRFGTKKSLEELEGETEFTYHLEFSREEQCFYINEESIEFTVKVKEGEPQLFTDKNDEDFIASIENITPEYDKTNNIQIKINIPFAPFLYYCYINELHEEQEGEKDDGTEGIIYDEILTPGEYILKFDDLQSNKEYKGFCMFNNNNGIEGQENDSNYKVVLIGNAGNSLQISSFPSHLIPSKDFNRKTQCADFIFASNSDSNNLNLFGPIAEKYCYDIMNEGEPIQIRITGSAECTVIQDDDNNEVNKDEEPEIRRKFTICAKAGPFNRDLKYKKEDEKVLFKENFEKFVDNLSTGQKIEDNLGLGGLIVESTYREKRFSIDINEDKAEEEKEDEKVEEDKKEKEVQKEKEEDKKEKEIEKLEENKDSEDKNELEKEVKEEEDKVEKEEDKREEERDKLQENEQKENDYKSQEEEERKEEEKSEEIKEEDKKEEKEEEKEEDKKEEENEEGKEEDKKEEEKEEDKKEEGKDKDKKDCKENPYCLLRDRSIPISNLMKTEIPDIITEIQNNGRNFSLLSLNEQLKQLDNFKEQIQVSENGDLKDLIDKLIGYSYYLSLIDCSIQYSKKDEFNYCRKNKSNFFTVVLQIISNKFGESKAVDNFLEKGISVNTEINFKYLLWLLNALTINPDSFSKGKSKILYDLLFQTKMNFRDYLKNIELFLNDSLMDDTKKLLVKKDLSILFAKSLSNLINIFHYEEIDGFTIESRKNGTGVLESNEGLNIHKNLVGFMEVFNDFGDEEYKISDKLSFFVKKYRSENEINKLLFENFRKLKEENEEQEIYSFSDKGINILLNPKKIIQKLFSKLEEKNETIFPNYIEATIQVVNFESPLIPIKRNDTEVTVRDFVDITFYDENNNRINVNSLAKDEKPIILYNSEYYPNLKHCFYFNEISNNLEIDGLQTEFKYEFNGTNNLKCSSEHLTSFTAGDFISNSKNLKEKTNYFLIIFLIVLIIIMLVIFFKLVSKDANKSKKEPVKKDKNENELNELNDE